MKAMTYDQIRVWSFVGLQDNRLLAKAGVYIMMWFDCWWSKTNE